VGAFINEEVVMKWISLLGLALLTACGSVHWSVTPYGSAGRTQDVGRHWQAGVSVTLYDYMPGVPAVPSTNVYKQRITVNNSSSSSSNSDARITEPKAHPPHPKHPKHTDDDDDGDD